MSRPLLPNWPIVKRKPKRHVWITVAVIFTVVLLLGFGITRAIVAEKYGPNRIDTDQEWLRFLEGTPGLEPAFANSPDGAEFCHELLLAAEGKSARSRILGRPPSSPVARQLVDALCPNDP